MHSLVIAHNAGHYNIRTSLAVVGIFGIITIISYFNELSKAGLLSVKPIPNAIGNAQRVARDVGQFVDPPDHGDVPDGDASHEHVDLDLGQIHDIIHSNYSKNNKLDADTPIKISVKLDKNSSYESHSNTSFKLYSYQNSLKNYWILPQGAINANANDGSTPENQIYKNSTIVLLYQHEPASYSVRDCLVASANQKGLITSNLPINAKFRKDWERLSPHQQDKFQVLYGSLSFGVCEGLTHPCSYLTMLSHPIDRILTVYHLCQLNNSHTFCHFTKTNITSLTLHEFIHSQGSSLFHKLLYYSRHCRLVGDDEVCLEDSKVTFVLSAAEREIFLQSILEHFEEWFSVVGLTQHMEVSLQLFDMVHNLNLSNCHAAQHSDISAIGDVPYHVIRAKLLADPNVQKWLSADLAIYSKLEEIFFRQVEAYKVSFHDVTPSVNYLKKKVHVQGKNRGHAKKLHPPPHGSNHTRVVKNKPDKYLDGVESVEHRARKLDKQRKKDHRTAVLSEMKKISEVSNMTKRKRRKRRASESLTSTVL